MWPNGFICENCFDKDSTINFSSKELQHSKLSSFIEERVNNFLKMKMSGVSVNIRILSNCEKQTEVKCGMSRIFKESGKQISTFPYSAKSIFAFQESDGYDLCFFGLHVQEYGSNCPEPNARRVNIAYIDSVKFFNPPHLRSAVYHEIILSYLQFVKNMGYMTAHIWVCPPSAGTEYIFYSHPKDQVILSFDLLLNWYMNMFEKGKEEGTICKCNNIYDEFIMNKKTLLSV